MALKRMGRVFGNETTEAFPFLALPQSPTSFVGDYVRFVGYGDHNFLLQGLRVRSTSKQLLNLAFSIFLSTTGLWSG
jgi:hypothetical protein